MEPKKFIVGVAVFAGLCIGIYLVISTVAGLDDSIQGAEAPTIAMAELARNIQETRLQAKEAKEGEFSIPLPEVP
jgi:hypothetical protein